MTGRAGEEGCPIWRDGIPHANHKKAGFTDTHSKAHTLNGNLVDITLARRMYDFAIIMVISRKDRLDISNILNEFDRVIFTQDVLVLVPSGNRKCIIVVWENWRCLSLGWFCRRMPLALRTAGCTRVAVQRDMS